MFKIEVTVWPNGMPPVEGRDHIVELACWNDGTCGPERGSYNVIEMEHGETPMMSHNRWRNRDEYPKPVVRVVGYPRSNEQGHLAGLAALILDRYSLDESSPVMAWEMVV